MKTLALFLIGVTTLVLAGGCAGERGSRQTQVAQRGAQVMPFDLEKTGHVFQPLDDGELQKLVVKDPNDAEQIKLIQSHLSEEALKFSRGDFSDPARIHGHDMPGLAELEAGASRIEIRYSALPNGGQIRYASTDPAMIDALHRWFGAQRSDHGHHAMHH